MTGREQKSTLFKHLKTGRLLNNLERPPSLTKFNNSAVSEAVETSPLSYNSGPLPQRTSLNCLQVNQETPAGWNLMGRSWKSRRTSKIIFMTLLCRSSEFSHDPSRRNWDGWAGFAAESISVRRKGFSSTWSFIIITYLLPLRVRFEPARPRLEIEYLNVSSAKVLRDI